MPPDTAQERTEPASPRRKEEARQRGQIGRSSDLSAAVILFGAMLLLDLTGGRMLGQLRAVMRFCLDETSASMLDSGPLMDVMKGVFGQAFRIVLPFLILVLILALLSSFAQVGFMLTFSTMQPSLSKLSPISGLKRMFGPRSFVQLLMGVAKMSLLTLVAYLTIKSRVHMLIFAPALPYVSVVVMSAELVMKVALRLAAVLLILGLIDLIYQRYKTTRDLRMTKEEVKEELKRMDGDPEIKRRRRQVQMETAIQRIRSAVPQADVVVTNPTELAVVIRYDQATMIAPKVTAKGADYLARRIREIAIESGVPIVERKPLAQALYKTVEVGQEVPPQFYRAVAEILAYVYELAGGRGTAAPAAAT